MPANKVVAFFKNPLGNLKAAQTAPLKIEKALIGQVPDASHGWLVALGLWLVALVILLIMVAMEVAETGLLL